MEGAAEAAPLLAAERRWRHPGPSGTPVGDPGALVRFVVGFEARQREGVILLAGTRGAVLREGHRLHYVGRRCILSVST